MTSALTQQKIDLQYFHSRTSEQETPFSLVPLRDDFSGQTCILAFERPNKATWLGTARPNLAERMVLSWLAQTGLVARENELEAVLSKWPQEIWPVVTPSARFQVI